HNAGESEGIELTHPAVVKRAMQLNSFNIFFIFPSFNGFIYDKKALKPVDILSPFFKTVLD
ncbi:MULTISPECIES: hypothetical protein, partial [unclassified Bartonella]|uniref:hypothetical protein n=1 Tax=unclassified Bartonella TaxID=2645622 RepID=UPI0035D04223